MERLTRKLKKGGYSANRHPAAQIDERLSQLKGVHKQWVGDVSDMITGMKQSEKEGYAWARRGIDTQRAAVEYLKKYAERQGAIPPYMRALGLGDRLPVASEEKYLNAWQEMGFPPETVALAYDKTVLKCHELKWPYCNGILKRWHEAGLHTPEEIERADKPPAKQPTQSAGDAWKYV